ncbi:unnamed protein product [Darwinula stevensoni]|uniref:Uncharacterized protein n=1 Tax=Darwinula stevensoni TaxID=69355 RepID=A0A7R8X8Z1_9CRUS|nr:unnamed protein product [Darwinula stevensoni]CAG0889165.1 unnamed protein product [Darwinula stevensoni]
MPGDLHAGTQPIMVFIPTCEISPRWRKHLEVGKNIIRHRLYGRPNGEERLRPSPSRSKRGAPGGRLGRLPGLALALALSLTPIDVKVVGGSHCSDHSIGPMMSSQDCNGCRHPSIKEASNFALVHLRWNGWAGGTSRSSDRTPPTVFVYAKKALHSDRRWCVTTTKHEAVVASCGKLIPERSRVAKF